MVTNIIVIFKFMNIKIEKLKLLGIKKIIKIEIENILTEPYSFRKTSPFETLKRNSDKIAFQTK